MKNKKKGFTLVELIVVLAILAILAAMLVPALTGYIDKANEKKVVAAARQYEIAAQTVVSDAYAANKKITVVEIETNDAKTSITVKVTVDGTVQTVTNSDVDSDTSNPYAKSFYNLAEIKAGDTASFTFENSKVKDGSWAKSSGYQATITGGAWVATKS